MKTGGEGQGKKWGMDLRRRFRMLWRERRGQSKKRAGRSRILFILGMSPADLRNSFIL